MVDTGLMRKNEFKYTYKTFKRRYKLNVKLINVSKFFSINSKISLIPKKKKNYWQFIY